VSRGLRLIGIVACLLPVLSVLQVVAVLVINPPGTPTMVVRAIEEGAWPDRRWRELDELGHVPRAFVSAEDQRFFLHGGFDWDAVCKAVDHNQAGGRVRGASTISQQVAKNVFLWQGRTWTRKVLEVWYTAWLEIIVPKRRILELYVNVAETGPGAFGAEAGALHHFGRKAAALSRDDAARLAGILPNPRGRSVSSEPAWEIASFVARHPAVFPEDRGYELVREEVARKTPPAWRCLWRAVTPRLRP
jgi:monofunctional biosynthetic peptidoglycan transglycosylase